VGRRWGVVLVLWKCSERRKQSLRSGLIVVYLGCITRLLAGVKRQLLRTNAGGVRKQGHDDR
jgi:hypothetical protein